MRKTEIVKYKRKKFTGQILPGGFEEVKRTNKTVTIGDERYFVKEES